MAAVGGGGAAPGGFDYNTWAAMNLKNGGGGGSGEAITPDQLIIKGIDKALQVSVAKVLGIHLNTDIEGKSAMAGFEVESVGSGFSPTNLTLFKDLQGAGPLGMFAGIFKYFTREIPNMFGGVEGGGDFAGGGENGGGGGNNGGGSDGGGGGDYSGTAQMGGQGGAGDMQGQTNFVPASDMPEMKDYGGKMMASTEVPMEDLGNLRPSSASAGGGRSDVGGMSV
jgi:hypothetical protein